MKLILVRHGETEENKADIIQGHWEGKLNAVGLHQAIKISLRLKGESIDAIYSSDLKRAFKTAQEIAKFHPQIPLTITPELRERYCGKLEGQSRKSLPANYEDFYSMLLKSGGEI